MIKLQQLKLKNFLSHSESVIDISNKHGLVLIEGINSDGRYDSNGSGKSTILEGIVYALSGNTLRNVGVNDVVNRNAKKDTCSSLSFLVDDVAYQVDRYRKDKVHGDKLDVWKGEESLAKRLNKETQDMLDHIIDIPYEVLVNTIFLGEGLSSRFTQLSDPAKKSLIESTLNLNYDIPTARDRASSALKELKIRKSNLQGQQMTLENLVSGEALEQATSRIHSLREELESLSEIDYTEEISQMNKQIEELTPKLEVLSQSMRTYRECTHQMQVEDNQSAHYIEEMKRVQSQESPVCSLCKQVLESAESKEAVLQEYRVQAEEHERRKQELMETLQRLPQMDILDSKYKEIQGRLIQLQSSISEKNKESRDAAVYRTTLQKDLEQCQSILNNYATYQESLNKISAEIAQIDLDISDYEYLYKLYSPTGIMVYVLEEAIQYINSRLKVYADILLDKSYSLSLEKGKIALVDEKGSSYQSLSNGEKRRLDICIQFSLHDYTHMYCGSSIDTLFLDEVLDTLDATGVNNIMEVLAMKREYCNLSRIFVITHNSSLKSYFDEVITVKKDTTGNSYISS